MFKGVCYECQSMTCTCDKHPDYINITSTAEGLSLDEARDLKSDIIEEWGSMQADMVNHPKHYQIDVKGQNVEVTELIEAVLTKKEYIGYLKGNILKYNIRAKFKNGTEDIKKSHFYSKILDTLI